VVNNRKSETRDANSSSSLPTLSPTNLSPLDVDILQRQQAIHSPLPRPQTKPVVRPIVAEEALIRQVDDAGNGQMSSPNLLHAINIAAKTLAEDHPVVQEARMLLQRMYAMETNQNQSHNHINTNDTKPTDKNNVNIKAIQRQLCGLFAAADFESVGTIPVQRLIHLAAVRCPRDGRKWKLLRCAQQVERHVPAATGQSGHVQMPDKAAHNIARRVRMLQGDDGDDDNGKGILNADNSYNEGVLETSERPSLGPVDFVLYFTHRWHGGMRHFSPTEVDATVLSMHQVVEQLRVRETVDMAKKID
jgi:hypothetical protein